jgi:transposase InsO family protein
MMNLGVALGLPKTLPPGDIQCGACLVSKSVNKNTLSLDSRSFLPLDAWNIDLVGPLEEPALSGGLYILTLRDIGSGYCEIKVLTCKSDATGVIIETVLRLGTLTGRRLKILCSDNRGKFNNKALSSFLLAQGISKERSIAYHHYQNGTIKLFKKWVAFPLQQ